MHSLTALLAPVALLLPSAAGTPVAAPAEPPAREAGPLEEPPLPLSVQSKPAPFRVLEQALNTPEQAQVRIERRVIIRISPAPPSAQEAMLAELPKRSMPQRYQEEQLRGCVPIAAIAGVQPVSQNRLLLFMRDRRVLSATLERACNAQDFYSGFYIERNDDGQLCSSRDSLQSRTGSKCQVAQLNRLLAVSD